LQKKKSAGQDINVELLIGAKMLEQAAASPSEDQILLLQIAGEFKDAAKAEDNFIIATTPELTATMRKHRIPELVTAYEIDLKIEIERKKQLTARDAGHALYG
jgi:hypothetical protein